MKSNYELEAKRENQKGTVLCGARIGYEGAASFTLADVCSAIDAINKRLGERGMPSVGCIVSEGMLVGRTGEAGYREPVYRCEFSTSPRAAAQSRDSFNDMILTYASELGTHFKQERMYVELDGVTHVLRRSNE